MRAVFSLLVLAGLLSSCSVFRTAESRMGSKIKREIIGSKVFAQSFTGFSLLDPQNGQTLAEVNGDHYFTPASNTKILTLATCLELLQDSVPGLLVLETDTSIIVRGVADPTFLHPKFEAWQQIAGRLQADSRPIILAPGPEIDGLGPGWAWDDAPYGYSAERSALPVFGNVTFVHAAGPDSLVTGKNNWHYLTKLPEGIRLGNDNILAQYGKPLIQYSDRDTFSEDFETFVPIRNVAVHGEDGFYMTGTLLGMGLQRTVYEREMALSPQEFKHWYSTPVDTVLRRMMHQSDNFIAEQMLLNCAAVKFNFPDQTPLIKWMLDSVLTTLPRRPAWVDGSGLSRYNLITPEDITQLLLRLWKTQRKERLFSLFPAGGVDGTIADWYAGKDGKPYIFAKTGSMGGVHCLSGYIQCNSGRVLIFSFMHNNFTGSNRPWKMEMQRILEMIRHF